MITRVFETYFPVKLPRLRERRGKEGERERGRENEKERKARIVGIFKLKIAGRVKEEQFERRNVQ